MTTSVSLVEDNRRDESDRIRAESALRESEGRYRLLAENADDLVTLLDPQENRLYISPSFFRVTGWQPEDILGSPWDARLHPEDISRIRQSREENLAGQTTLIEHRIRCRDGSWIWVEARCKPLFDPAGRVIQLLNWQHDITQRKAHEREIERLTRLYATLSQINQAIVRVQSHAELAGEVARVAADFGGFKLVWVGQHNPQTREVTPLGWAGEPREFIHEFRHSSADTAEHRCLCAPAIRENRPCVSNDLGAARDVDAWSLAFEQAGIRAAAVFPVRVRSVVWGVFGVYASEPGVFQDQEITLLEEAAMDIGYAVEHIENEARRKRAELALRESETHFRSMFEVACIGMAQADPLAGQWLRVNPKMCEITGYSAEELLGMRVPEITHPEDRQRDWELFQRVIRGEMPDYRLEKRYLRKDGRVAWVNVNMTVIRDGAGRPLRTMATIEDITERRRLEEERELTVRLLDLINASRDLHGLMRKVTALLREWFDCEAVGIRLRDGDDFPYFETHGFPAEFVRLENHLCLRDAAGRPGRNPSGCPILECMCGNILCGRYDPAQPFFTARGSFWANSTTRLLAATTPADLQAQTRNRCNGAGYESVALIALRVGETTYGLLQLNDKRPDRFTPEQIALLERLADSLATAIAHRQGAEQLRASEERYRLLADNADDFVLVNHVDGRRLYVSPSFYRVTGWTPEDLQATDWRTRVHPDDLPLVEQTRAANLAGETTQIEYRMLCKDRSWLWLDIRCKPLVGPDGRVVQMQVWARDVTRRKLAEAERDNLSQQRELALRAADMGWWHYDLISQVASWDGRYGKIFGVSGSHCDNAELLKLLHPGDLPQVLAAVEAALDPADPRPYRAEYRINRADGSQRWVEAHGMAQFAGGGERRRAISLVGTVADITARKQAEEALRASEEEHRVLFESAHDALMTLAPPAWHFASGNPAAVELFGARDEADFITRGPWEYSPQFQPDGRLSADAARERIATVLREGSQFFEWRHRRLDGTEFPATVQLTRFELGGEMRVQGTVRDISEAKRLAAEKDSLEAQLQQAMKLEAVGRLAGGVAHDFNNALGVILGYGELALEEADPATPVREYVRAILDAAQRSAGITRQLLAFARRDVIQPRVLDLNETVEAMLTILRRLLGENIDLIWQPGSRLGPVYLDPSQLDQILANLCVNARDAIVDVGRVTIATQNAVVDAGSAATPLVIAAGEYVTLAVSDTGCGMSREIMDRIFEPFFTTKGPGKGTGLGLATVYGAVKQNRGTIRVASEPGRGTTFQIYLPRHHAPPGKTVESVPAAPRSRGETVLAVEDEEGLLRVVEIGLRSLGYSVLTARTPHEALQMLEQRSAPIQLLLTDVILPEMNGKELADRLQVGRPQLKRLFMSGYTADVIAEHGVLEKGIRLLQKPFSTRDLAFAVRAALDEPA